MTVRTGVSRFQTLTFITYGAEIALPSGPKTSFTVGIDFQSTKRTPTPPQQEKFDLPPELWQLLWDDNFGLPEPDYDSGPAGWDLARERARSRVRKSATIRGTRKTVSRNTGP